MPPPRTINFLTNASGTGRWRASFAVSVAVNRAASDAVGSARRIAAGGAAGVAALRAPGRTGSGAASDADSGAAGRAGSAGRGDRGEACGRAVAGQWREAPEAEHVCVPPFSARVGTSKR